MDGMKPRRLVIPRHVAAKKPPHGAPCNSCGVCCMATLCAIGRRVLQKPEHPGPCPALEARQDGTYACGLVANPATYLSERVALHGAQRVSEAVAHAIGSGTGCDARINGEPRNMPFYQFLIEHDIRNAHRTYDAGWVLFDIPIPEPSGRRGS